MSARLRDVASRAGVSIKTVSRVVNNQGEISAGTRQRVLAAIDELGYRPSKLARALVTQHTDTVGLVLGDITNPFYPEVARGVLDAAEAEGYNVFVCNSDADLQRETRILQSLVDHAVDGMILFPTFELEPSLPLFAGPHRPVVAVNRPFAGPGISSVMMRAHRGAKLAIDYLVGQGHTAIAMLAGPTPATARFQRLQGFRDGLVEHGLPVVEEWIVPGAPVQKRGRASACQLLTRYPEITAIFAYNDLLAIGAMQACHELGRRVPQDCAIVGYDDIPLADVVSPALTTIRVDKYDLGRQAMNRLLQMFDHPAEEFPPMWVDVELVERQSA